MNKVTKSLLTLSCALLGLASCSKWTDTEIKNPTDLTSSSKTPEYYEQLRAYKKTDHQVAFGWFGNWTGTGASLQGSLAGLPDSVDFVSLWGGWKNPSEAQLADLRYVQQVKGTRAMICFIVQDLGAQITPAISDAKKAEYTTAGIAESEHNSKWTKEFWGWSDDITDEGTTARMNAIAKYANAICDTIDKYGYDGFDIDYEPNFGHRGNLSGNAEHMLHFIQTLGKRIGPKSGTNRLLVIDGEPQSIVPASGPYFDYFIVQAYNCSGDADLDNRLSRTITNFTGVLSAEEVARKYIVTENFEDHAQAGGFSFTDRYGNEMKSLEGMARWTPFVGGKAVRKAGVGTYHMEYEYIVSGLGDARYPFLRKAIQIMNPSRIN